MIIRFELVDSDGDLLMRMKGGSYIPNIGEDVLFNSDRNDVHIYELANVKQKYYSIHNDTLDIQCEIYNQPNDYGYEEFRKFNS